MNTICRKATLAGIACLAIGFLLLAISFWSAYVGGMRIIGQWRTESHGHYRVMLHNSAISLKIDRGQAVVWEKGIDLLAPSIVLLVISSLAMILIAQRARQKQPATFKYCPSCGYDLRATPYRCPECGFASQRPSSS